MTHFYTPDSPYLCPHMIEGVVFDNDNTLYLEPQNAHEYHQMAAVRAVQEQLPDMQDWEVRLLLAESKKKYGGSLDVFEKEHGADMDKLRADQYAHLIESTTDNGFFNPDKTPKRGMTQLVALGIKLAIATHGNKEWTFHSLQENQLAHMFNDRGIVTKGDVSAGKNIGPEMYDAVLDALGVPETADPSQRGFGYAMIEDTMQNLKFAKDRGMTTVLIRPDFNSDDDIADYVDVVVKDNKEAVQAILESNQARFLHLYEIPEMNAEVVLD